MTVGMLVPLTVTLKMDLTGKIIEGIVIALMILYVIIAIIAVIAEVKYEKETGKDGPLSEFLSYTASWFFPKR